jgi:hypothetical protein
MSIRGDFDIKADVADCGNPGNGKSIAKAAIINTNKSLRMTLSFSEAAQSFRPRSRFLTLAGLAIHRLRSKRSTTRISQVRPRQKLVRKKLRHALRVGTAKDAESVKPSTFVAEMTHTGCREIHLVKWMDYT